MELIKLSLAAFFLIYISLFSIQAWSHGGGHGGGYGFRGGYGGFHGGGYIGLYVNPYLYGYPYYNYPYNTSQTIIFPSSPTYVEQNTITEDSPEHPAGYWYYCTSPEGYYPYIKECSTDWQKVNPTPPLPNNH
ncbi:MAG: hypothetical protein WCG11_07255 [Methylococcaceae bacterium]|jgi:hypothetical protein